MECILLLFVSAVLVLVVYKQCCGDKSRKTSGGSRGVSLVAVETPFLDGAARSHVLQSSFGT